MATMTEPAGTQETIRESVGPALEVIEGNVRQARRAVVASQHAAEDFADSATLQIRKHPLGAVAMAAGASAFVGCVIGFILGWRVPGRESE